MNKIVYDAVSLMCAKKLMGSQLRLLQADKLYVLLLIKPFNQDQSFPGVLFSFQHRLS